MKLDVRAAIQFFAVAEELSFRRAAERLGVAQPWLSTRIRRLEEELGFPLFIRSTRVVELTAEGRLFMKDAATLAAAAAAVEETARALRRRQTGRLRIGVPPYHGLLQQKSAVIRRFAERHPFTSLELDVGWTPNLVNRLINRTIDFAFIIDETHDLDLQGMTIGTTYPVLVIRTDHELAGRKVLSLGDLRGHEVAVFTRGLNPPLFDKLYDPFEAAGVRLRQVTEFGDLVVEAGKPPAFPLSTTLAWSGAPEGEPMGAVIRRLTDHQPMIPLTLVRHKAWRSPVQETFWALAKESVDGRV
jgi:DNA-binding transcriptional LysR family regulator